MARVPIAHHPEISNEGAFQVFQTHLGDKYTVRWPVLGRRGFFWVQSGEWIGTMINLRQTRDGSSFQVAIMTPTVKWMLISMLIPIVGFVAWLNLGPKRKALEQEVVSFIKNASEFN